MRHSWLFLFALLLLPAVAQAGEPVGTVQEIKGHATLKHEGESAPQDVALNAAVFDHDVVEAGDDAHVTIKFADETLFVLSGKGKLTVSDYVYDPKKPEGNKSVFSLVGAAFSYVGGLLDKGPSPNATLKLDYGSIGIRGTKIIGALANGSDWIYLQDGKITVDTDGGEVILHPGDGTSLDNQTSAPPTPYAFSPDEVAWLQKLVDDPAARSNPAMAAAASSFGAGRAASSMAANNMPASPAMAPGAPSSSGGGGSAAPSSTASGLLGASGPAAASAPAAPPAAPAEAAPTQMAMADTANTKAEAEKKAEPAARARAEVAAAPADVIPLSNLSPATLGTHIAQDGEGIVRIDTQTPITINLASADISAQHLENTTLHFSAMLKAKDLDGSAYLEMWVHFPGVKGGNYFSRGLDNLLTKSEDWKLFHTPFLLKPGQSPDKVTLNLVINGHGTVWVKDVHLQK